MPLRAIETFALRFLVRAARLLLEQTISDAPPTEDWKKRARLTLEYEYLMMIEKEL